MKKETKISVGMFYSKGIMKHLVENKGNPQTIAYKNSNYPLDLKLDLKTIKPFNKDRGLLVCAFVENESSPQIVSTYFSRSSNKKLSSEEAHTFGYEIGKTFDQGASNYKIMEDYDFSMGETFPAPPYLLVNVVNSAKNKSKFNIPNKIKEGLMVPVKIHNLENVCEGISDGQKRISSNKIKRLVPFF